MPGWMLAPWTFDALLVLIAVPWAMVGVAAAWWAGPGALSDVAALGSLVLAVMTAVGCVARAAANVRRTIGRGFVSGWVVFSHVFVVVLGVPLVWVVVWVGLMAIVVGIWGGW